MPYNRKLDRMVGHDYPGVRSPGFVRWEIDELELGAGAAIALDDPEQAWWELIGNRLVEKMEQDEKARNSTDPNDVSMGGVTP